MANVSSIAKAVAADYSRAQLVTWRMAATEAIMAELPRVEITGANFDAGGSSGEFVNGRPERILEICNLAIDLLDNTEKRNRNQFVGDFSQRRAGW